MSIVEDRIEDGLAYELSVGKRAASGALWTVICSAASKVVTLGGQILLAWFLVPDDMGLVAMAMSITTIIALFASAGLQDVLVQRQKELQKLVRSAFWLSLGLCALGALAIAGISPLAGAMFGEPRVIPLVLLASLVLPLSSFGTIYTAKLYHDMRFKTMAQIHLASGVIQIGGAVSLAALGFGPYSILIPCVVASGAGPLMTRIAAGKIYVGRPRITYWRELLRPGVWLMLFGLFNAMQSQGMNLVLGILRDSRITGLFFWGFHISSQFLFLLAVKLRQVLFPSLAKLNDKPEQQFAAVQRAWRMLTLIALPVCILQAGLADPIIPLLFKQKWAGSVPVVQWLSVGMLALPVHIVALSALMASGRFGMLAILGAVQAVMLLSATAAGALLGDQGTIAATAGMAMLVMNLCSGYVAVRRFGRSIADLLFSVGGFYLMAAAAGMVWWLARMILPSWSDLAVAGVGASITCVAYAAMVRAFAWNTWLDMMSVAFSRRGAKKNKSDNGVTRI